MGSSGIGWAKPNFQYFQCGVACGARDLNTSASRVVVREALEVGGHDMAVDGCGKTQGRRDGEASKRTIIVSHNNDLVMTMES